APAPDNGDLAGDVQRLEHASDVPAPVPAVAMTALVDRAVFELPREQRPALLELAQDVAPERGVLLENLTPPPIPPVVFPPALLPDTRPDQRPRLDRVDERVELEQLAFLPEQPVELGPVEGPEPAPENEVLRRRNGGDRIELEEAEPPHGVEDAARRAV